MSMYVVLADFLALVLCVGATVYLYANRKRLR